MDNYTIGLATEFLLLSNLGFGLLGQGLAASQNSSYDIWMKKNVFDPLEMKNSGFKLIPEWVTSLNLI